MKIALVFFLVAVSSCGALPNGGGLTDKQCVTKALKSSGKLVLEMSILICAKDKNPDAVTEDQWNDVFAALDEALQNVQCPISKFLILGEMASNTLSGKDKANKLLPIIKPALETAGLSTTAFGTLCTNLEPALTRECLPFLLGGKLPQFLTDTQEKLCNGFDENVTVKELTEILKSTQCVFGKAKLDAIYEMIDSLTGDLLDPKGAGAPVVALVDQSLCTVITALLDIIDKLPK